MIYPKFINKNSCIGVPAPSDGSSCLIRENSFLQAKKTLEDIGYKLVLSENLLKSYRGRSSTAKERAEEVNKMFASKDVDMILCACGGEFLVEMLPYVYFDLLVKNPKYVAGFSDPTGLLYTITSKYDIATIYGHNFNSFGNQTLYHTEKEFLDIINGELLEQESCQMYEENPFERVTGLEDYNLDTKVYWKTLDEKEVNVKGRMLGGCFDLISELAGTKYDGINQFNEKYKDDGIIWFFDNCEISCEETIRTLWKMNELGYFKYAKCVIFGRFGALKSYFEYDTKSCLMDSVLGSLNIPVIYDADISHKDPCISIINGAIASVMTKDGKGKIKFELN